MKLKQTIPCSSQVPSGWVSLSIGQGRCGASQETGQCHCSLFTCREMEAVETSDSRAIQPSGRSAQEVQEFFCLVPLLSSVVSAPVSDQ